MSNKSYTNEHGILKFTRGSMYEGIFEVYPYNMEPADIKHAITELTEYAKNSGIDLVGGLTPAELAARIKSDCEELRVRGETQLLQESIKGFVQGPTVVRVDLTVGEMALCETGRKILAIKEVRARTGLGLRDAKDQVDAYCKAWEEAGRPHGGLTYPLSNTPLPQPPDRW